MSESIRMSADDLVVLLLASREHTTSEFDARRLLAEVKDNHSAEQATEIDRLRAELASCRADVLSSTAERFERRAHQLNAEWLRADQVVAVLRNLAIEGPSGGDE